MIIYGRHEKEKHRLGAKNATRMANIGMPMIHERRKAMFECLRCFLFRRVVFLFRHEQMNVTLLTHPIFSGFMVSPALPVKYPLLHSKLHRLIAYFRGYKSNCFGLFYCVRMNAYLKKKTTFRTIIIIFLHLSLMY